MQAESAKPVIGFTCGDLNGIGTEIIIKTLHDQRILDLCTPIIFASNKLINFYRKSLADINFNYQSLRELNRPNPKQVNVYQCWEEDVNITPGQLTPEGGMYAIKSLEAAAEALKAGHIQAVVTAPIHKKNIHSDRFPFSGHTPFFQHVFDSREVLMLMCASNMRIGLLTEHVALKDAAQHVTRERILAKLQVMKQSLQKDFGIDKPRIAVLGLNPHAGDEGLIGQEEEQVIKPTVKEARQSMGLVYGPYSADAFFARAQFASFDGVLAMYHDQGLIPFKSMAIGEGVNYSAGLPVVRTSPDHGTAFDIAGKGQADESSFREALYMALDILRMRNEYQMNRSNPMRKMSDRVVANAEDEKIEETE